MLTKFGESLGFDKLIPGMFVVLNLSLLYWPDIGQVPPIVHNPLVASAFLITFGFLVGVLLRLFMTDFPDRISAYYLRSLSRHAKVSTSEESQQNRFERSYRPLRYLIRVVIFFVKLPIRGIEELEETDRDTFPTWARDSFPYIGWIGEVCKRDLPSEVGGYFSHIYPPILRSSSTETRSIIAKNTLFAWIKRGWVRTSRTLPGYRGRVICWADADDLDRLRRLRETQHSWWDPPLPRELTTPREPPKGRGTVYCTFRADPWISSTQNQARCQHSRELAQNNVT